MAVSNRLRNRVPIPLNFRNQLGLLVKSEGLMLIGVLGLVAVRARARSFNVIPLKAENDIGLQSIADRGRTGNDQRREPALRMAERQAGGLPPVWQEACDRPRESTLPG